MVCGDGPRNRGWGLGTQDQHGTRGWGLGTRDTGLKDGDTPHGIRDTGTNEQITNSAQSPGDGFFYREAYTTFAADEVIARLVNDCGLQADRESVPQPGRIVFVHREAVSHQLSAVS